MAKPLSDQPADPFAPIVAFAAMLAPFSQPWFVSGGWAIDLFTGTLSRPHSDIEIGIWRHDQPALHQHLGQHLPTWHRYQIVEYPSGIQREPWPAATTLALPSHQLFISPTPLGPGAFPDYGFFLNDQLAGQWQWRRNPTLTRPAHTIIATSPLGIPILAPEIQLLYKAHHHQPKDDADFAAALPHLTTTQRDWLRTALQQHYPADPWLPALTPPTNASKD